MNTFTTIQTESRMRPNISTRKHSTLVELASRFISTSRPSAKEISIFKEQFYTLILTTTGPDRKKISDILAKNEYSPKTLIIFFAMEEIAIATQPLLHSPVLQSADLNLIINNSSYEHAKVIARRADLNASNVQTLLNVDANSGSIKLILAGNSDFAKNPEISRLIKAETELTDWEEKPENITTAQPEVINKTKIKTGTKDLSQSLLKLANKGGKLSRKPIGKKVKPAFMQFTKKQIEQELLTTARAMDLTAFSKAVQSFCNLKPQTTFNFLKKQDAGMLATLLRALEVSDISAARILLMMNNNIGRNPHIFRIVTDKYSNLDHKECSTFYEKLGANFSQLDLKQDVNATRYALSLAARERRAALLRKKEPEVDIHSEVKLRA